MFCKPPIFGKPVAGQYYPATAEARQRREPNKEKTPENDSFMKKCLINKCLANYAQHGLLLLTITSAQAALQSRVSLNLAPAWRFHLGQQVGQPWLTNYDDRSWDIISLPHSQELFSPGLSGFPERGRESGWYRRLIHVHPEWLARKVFLEFQGSMQTTEMWVNGRRVGEYAVSGFDSFHFDITPFLRAGDNLLAVKVDNQRSADIPPDGHTADYILFGGLYRDVMLHVTDTVHLTFPWEARQAGVRLTLPKVSEEAATIRAESTVRNESQRACHCSLITEVRDRDHHPVTTMLQEHDIAPGTAYTFLQESEPIPQPHLWSPDDPYLYQVRTIVREGDRELDRVETPFGFRWVSFDKEKGFFPNGKHLKLVGANRHQTWPFIGNAVPAGLQRRDAEQLKAMGVNWVRLSHYPQDPHFLDALDEFGIMALAEPPTWMDRGNEKWMVNLEASFRSMIRRDRNHPCIILWATCINHHPAEPALVRAAKEEDPTRERGQDTVPIPMAFTPLLIPGHGALVTEHTGHTFPAQRGARTMVFRPRNAGRGIVETNINREFEQARRHWRQLNAAYLQQDNAGLAVWCMYDYNTFHNMNEPGIVWHGVCDLFRIPKYSFFWHQSELTTAPMEYIVRVDATRAAVFSNCEQVRFWQGSEVQSPASETQNPGTGAKISYSEVATQKPDSGFVGPDGSPISYALRHPPFTFTIPASATRLKAEGLIGGVVRATYEWKQFGEPVALTLEADRPTITADGADLSRIMVTAVDANGTPVDTCTAPVTFDISGLGQLIGENPVNLRAGKMIVLAQSGFIPDELTITATSPGLATATAKVTTEPVPPGVDMPKDLPAKQPTKRRIISEPNRLRSATAKILTPSQPAPERR
jgi:beta-galactosidase